MKLCRAYLTAISLAAAVAGMTLAQQQRAAAPTKQPSYKYVDVRADKWQYKWGNSDIAVLSGNVKITQGDTVLTADRIEYNQKEDVQTAVAAGRIKIADPQTEITGDKGTAFFNERRAVIEGNVKVVVNPKPKAEAKDGKTLRSEFRERTVITCETIEYNYRDKEARASGNLQVVQKDRVLTARQAGYQAKKDLVILSGEVKARDSKGQTFSAPGPVTISIKPGEEWIEMEHAVGTFRIREQPEEEETKPASSSAAQKAGGKSPERAE